MPQIQLQCPKCLNVFMVYPSRLKRVQILYCSNRCKNLGRGGPNHPSRKVNAIRPYIDGKLEWRYRRIAETVLGRPLKKGEHVHHINGDRNDNRNQNLVIVTHRLHRILHARMKKRNKMLSDSITLEVSHGTD